MTCTAGGPHLGEVTGSFVAMIVDAGLAGLARDGRPLLRWLIVERGLCPGVAEMSASLSELGVEVTRRAAPLSADGSIAAGRRVLLSAAADLDLEDDPIVLMLDDDLAFDALVSGPDGVEIAAPWPWLPAVWAFHEARPAVDVALGGVTGAPPLPASSTLATNLYDLQAAEGGWPVLDGARRWSEPDYYYDLSSARTVEEPYAMLEAGPRGPELIDALMLHGVLARPLVATPTTLVASRPAPIVRGGNTILFQSKWLTLPHPQLTLGSLRLRRADTVWAQAAVSLWGCRIGQFPLPLRHLRRGTGWTPSAASAWRERLLADLGGAGLYRGLERWRTQEGWRRFEEVGGAASEVEAALGRRRLAVTEALGLARERCAALLCERPELGVVEDAIEGGLVASRELDLGADASRALLEELGASLEARR